MKGIKRRFIGRAVKGRGFKKTAAIAAGVIAVVGATAGATFLINENRHKQMAAAVRLMETERQNAAVETAAVAYAGAVEESNRFTLNIFKTIAAAAGAFAAAFLGRLGSLAVGSTAGAAAVGILPFAFVIFTLFALLYRMVYGGKSLKGLFTLKNTAVLCGASVLAAVAFEAMDRLISNQLLAAFAETAVLLCIIAAAWFLVFADFKGEKAFRDRRSLVLLAAALAAGGLFGGAELLLVHGGQSAPAARASLFALWLTGLAAAVLVYFLQKKKRGGLSKKAELCYLSE